MSKVATINNSTYGRSVVLLMLSVLAGYLFLELRSEWSAMHKWNRAVGDVSVLLLAITMAVGPMSRIWRGTRRLLPWRRELGILTFCSALVHTIIILAGWIEWDWLQLFGYVVHPQTLNYVMFQQGFGLGNIVGIIALLYALVLAITSNNLSQRILGGNVWKFVQLSAYVLWSLVVLHTAYFLYLHFQHFDRAVPAPNKLQIPFAILVLLIIVLQAVATWITWQRNSRRGSVARDDDARLEDGLARGVTR